VIYHALLGAMNCAPTKALTNLTSGSATWYNVNNYGKQQRRAGSMEETTENKKSVKVRNRRVHMANERTFLAWIRTSIGIMAFGFVVEKFALFIKKLSYFLGKPIIPEVAPPSLGYSSIFGIVLVAMGALMGALAFVRYKKVEREIDEDTYQPSLILDILVVMGILAIGFFLVFYMIHSI
jgi:uncharacterized membrane protein YidH (DUF202 family)